MRAAAPSSARTRNARTARTAERAFFIASPRQMESREEAAAGERHAGLVLQVPVPQILSFHVDLQDVAEESLPAEARVLRRDAAPRAARGVRHARERAE